jgi:hypothetical protein
VGHIDGDEPPQIAITTTDGKAYYYLTHLLKTNRIPFTSITPGDPLTTGLKLLLTTRKEKPLFTTETLCYEDLTAAPLTARERILAHLYDSKDQPLLIGVDPGERTGWAVAFGPTDVAGGVATSIDRLIDTLTRFAKSSTAAKKIVRIGDGHPAKALEIASRLSTALRGEVAIEIVDERGTSSTRGGPNKRGLRDQLSARLIALRSGRHYRRPTNQLVRRQPRA